LNKDQSTEAFLSQRSKKQQKTSEIRWKNYQRGSKN